MGRKKTTLAAPPPSKPLQAQGSGRNKRTPMSAFDPAAGADIYEPERVVGERQKNLGGGKTETQYEVKWKGYDPKQNTYEPISNLAGCEDMIAEYKQRKQQQDAEREAEVRELKRRKQDEAEQARQAAAAAAAAARVVAQDQQGTALAELASEPTVVTPHSGPAKKSKRSSPWWEVFSEEGAPPGHACCTLSHPKKVGQICGEPISIKGGPTGMGNHVQYIQSK